MIGREEKIFVLESAIDDMSPEIYSYLLPKLLQKGALDAYVTPVFMKKNRPGSLLTVICRENSKENLLEQIFKETTTLGVRFREETRRVLSRGFTSVTTPWGEVRIKTGFDGDSEQDPLQISPEYEDCRRVADAHGVPLQEVYAVAKQAYEQYKKDRQK